MSRLRLSTVRRGRLPSPLPSTAARWTTWPDGHAIGRRTVYARTRSESRLDRWPSRRLGVDRGSLDAIRKPDRDAAKS